MKLLPKLILVLPVLLLMQAFLITTAALPDFNRDIRPILSDHCYACHGPDEGKQKAGLRLDQKESALGELKSGGRAIVPGDLAHSSLVERVTSTDPEEIMSPPKAGKALSQEQIDTLVAWVASSNSIIARPHEFFDLTGKETHFLGEKESAQFADSSRME